VSGVRVSPGAPGKAKPRKVCGAFTFLLNLSQAAKWGYFGDSSVKKQERKKYPTLTVRSRFYDCSFLASFAFPVPVKKVVQVICNLLVN
jgi:hypothetical protein